jgi:hypothetical protein
MRYEILIFHLSLLSSFLSSEVAPLIYRFTLQFFYGPLIKTAGPLAVLFKVSRATLAYDRLIQALLDLTMFLVAATASPQVTLPG